MQQHIYKSENSFPLERGGELSRLQITYHTAGVYKPGKSQVVWVCHALTGNSNPFEWWGGLFGEKGLFNPNEHFIVCANILGSCYGTTGPLSDDGSGHPYYHSFPEVTIRDMAKAHDLLRRHLGIKSIHSLVGASLGGQQALEWAIAEPDLIDRLILIATNAQHSPWGIAFNESQRLAIQLDPTWAASNPEAGLEGMKVARSFALLSYRHYHTYQVSQFEKTDDKWDDFRASSYQRYQGYKLSLRFNAFSYWHLSKAMDSHNVGRHRGGIATALSQIKAETLVIGIDTDELFPFNEQQLLAEKIPFATLKVLETPYGHDGFLIEPNKLSSLIREYEKEALISRRANVA